MCAYAVCVRLGVTGGLGEATGLIEFCVKKSKQVQTGVEKKPAAKISAA
jgi:hypothetical protein